MRTPRSREIYEGFAQRLSYSLQQKGHVSEHSKSGVRLKQLSQVADCSLQMAHRYINGEAMPDYMALKAIADWLEVSAGWLMYGEISALPYEQKSKIMLDVETLEYVLNTIYAFHIQNFDTRITAYVMGVLRQLSTMDGDRKSIKQTIDIAADSLRYSNISEKFGVTS